MLKVQCDHILTVQNSNQISISLKKSIINELMKEPKVRKFE
jgi:hypothetical protein